MCSHGLHYTSLWTLGFDSRWGLGYGYLFQINVVRRPFEIPWTHLITPSRNFVEVRWRSLFLSTSLDKRCTTYNAPPTSRKRVADRWSLRNFMPAWSSLFIFGKAQESHRARSGLYDGCSNGVPPIHFFLAEHRIQFRSRPMRFLGFSNLENGAPRQEISKWSTVWSTFSRSGWSVVRNASLAKGGTSKNGPLSHLHKVPTRTLQTALVNEVISGDGRTDGRTDKQIYDLPVVPSYDALCPKTTYSVNLTSISYKGKWDCYVLKV
jgi:hypothetical protein